RAGGGRRRRAPRRRPRPGSRRHRRLPAPPWRARARLSWPCPRPAPQGRPAPGGLRRVEFPTYPTSPHPHPNRSRRYAGLMTPRLMMRPLSTAEHSGSMSTPPDKDGSFFYVLQDALKILYVDDDPILREFAVVNLTTEHAT